jgi:hypothetical protein
MVMSVTSISYHVCVCARVFGIIYGTVLMNDEKESHICILFCALPLSVLICGCVLLLTDEYMPERRQSMTLQSDFNYPLPNNSVQCGHIMNQL